MGYTGILRHHRYKLKRRALASIEIDKTKEINRKPGFSPRDLPRLILIERIEISGLMNEYNRKGNKLHY